MAVLKDGEPHPFRELHACLYDTLVPIDRVRVQVAHLRGELRKVGETIVTDRENRTYRYVSIDKLAGRVKEAMEGRPLSMDVYKMVAYSVASEII